jgi:hypothetical protein
VLFSRPESWGAPESLALIVGNIKSTVTVNGEMYLSDDEDNLYNFDVGTGSTAKIRTPWVSSQQSDGHDRDRRRSGEG